MVRMIRYTRITHSRYRRGVMGGTDWRCSTRSSTFEGTRYVGRFEPGLPTGKPRARVGKDSVRHLLPRGQLATPPVGCNASSTRPIPTADGRYRFALPGEVPGSRNYIAQYALESPDNYTMPNR